MDEFSTQIMWTCLHVNVNARTSVKVSQFERMWAIISGEPVLERSMMSNSRLHRHGGEKGERKRREGKSRSVVEVKLSTERYCSGFRRLTPESASLNVA